MNCERMGTSFASLNNIIAMVPLDEGLNHFVFVTYKEVVATMAIAPFAYFLERYIM